MTKTKFCQQMAFLALAVFIVSAAPASAGWLQDAVGDFINETLSDSKVIGVTIAGIGFIWGCLSWIFGWGSLKMPIGAILIGSVIGLADTFIGT